MPATYEPIATTTLGTAANNVTFSSIPATYTDLRMVIVTGCDSGATASNFTFNGDTGSNYSNTNLTGDGTTAASGQATGAFNINALGVLDSSTGKRGMTTIDVFSYAGSTNKTALITTSRDANGSGTVGRVVGLWRNTAAITSIRFFVSNNLCAGSTATLYGILKA
jgi:hypothetical protein